MVRDPQTAVVFGAGTVGLLASLALRGYIVTGHDLVHVAIAEIGGESGHGRIPFAMETSVPGIFSAGDVRAGSTKQVASAVGEGASAAIAIREYLKTE